MIHISDWFFIEIFRGSDSAWNNGHNFYDISSPHIADTINFYALFRHNVVSKSKMSSVKSSISAEENESKHHCFEILKDAFAIGNIEV